MGYVFYEDEKNERFMLKEAVAGLGAELIGKELYDKYGT